MLKQPRIGDTVLLKGVVTSISPGSIPNMRVNFIDCYQPGPFTSAISTSRISEIIDSPLIVGDQVSLANDEGVYAQQGRTLLFIHGDPDGEGTRKWGVVAFKGDLPTCHKLADLRRFAECAD